MIKANGGGPCPPPFFVHQMVNRLYTLHYQFCHPERSAAESKDDIPVDAMQIYYNFSPGFSVHNFVVFCFQFLYSMFKTKKYLNNRKVAEAVSRLLSNSVDPLFYLSSFQTLSREPRCLVTATGVFPFPLQINDAKPQAAFPLHHVLIS